MKTRLTLKPISFAILASALCLSGAAWAQDTNTANQANAPKASSSGEDQYPDLIELDPFGGVSTWGQIQRGLDFKMHTDWLAGGRIAFNPSKWWGIELWMDYDRANVSFRLPSNGGIYPPTSPYAGAPIPTYSFEAANWMWGLNPVLNLKPRGSKFQPYLTVGVGGAQFTPDATAEAHARDPVINSSFYVGNLNDNLQFQVNYGGGIKWHLSDHFGLRIDARGFWSRNPTYGLPNYPDGGVYIPSHDHLLGFQGSLGLVFYGGQVSCDKFASQIPPQFQPAPAIPTPTISGAEGQTICQGKPVTLHANTTPAAGRNYAFAWTLNGAQQTATGPDFTFTPNNTGSFNVQVTVTDTTAPPKIPERPKKVPERCWPTYTIPPNPAPVTATATVTVNDQGPTISSVTADNQSLTCASNPGTHTATLTVTAAAGPCSTNLTYKWTVSEGSLSNDTSQNPTFDASTLQFDPAQNQTKTVTATVVVTDENGRTATQSTTISVACQPQCKRLDDVVFAKNKDRVNNCGKDILIDQAAKQAGTDYDIVLVGHRDADEQSKAIYVGGARPPRGRHQRPNRHTLDEQRVLNAAAVLSGGTATCGNVDPSHIRVQWVGTDQTHETRPGLCGTSNIKERKGYNISEADKNRRVEVWLVPHNGPCPQVQDAKPLPEDEVKALGCPK